MRFLNLWRFFPILFFQIGYSQRTAITQGREFSTPSGSEPLMLVAINDGYAGLFSNQKLTGAYGFQLYFFDKELNMSFKLDLDNSQNEFYNSILFKNDTLRIFFARPKNVNGTLKIEYETKFFDLKTKTLKPNTKRIATRNQLPKLNYYLDDLSINPYEFQVMDMGNQIGIFYFEVKGKKTFAVTKLFDENFNFIGNYEVEVPSFEKIKIQRVSNFYSKFTVSVQIIEKKYTNIPASFLHIYFDDSLRALKNLESQCMDSYFSKNMKMINTFGNQKPEYIFVYENGQKTDSVIIDVFFHPNPSSQFVFCTTNNDIKLYQYLDKDDLFSIYNLVNINVLIKKSTLIPYFATSSSLEKKFIQPIFLGNIVLVYGKINSKNHFFGNKNTVYSIWNMETQTLSESLELGSHAFETSKVFLKNDFQFFVFSRNKDNFKLNLLTIK